METPVTPSTREIYRMAYRNVRCARSVAPNSRPSKIPYHWEDRNQVMVIVNHAYEHRSNRNDFSNGWVNQDRRHAFVIRTIFKGR